jgi:oxygen-independent coproporphyrinogen-3 oxidase
LLRSLREVGINRISVGAQIFDDALLHTLSRTHSSQRTIQAIEDIYQAGITNISIDLMYDLPNQTLSSWQATVTQALKLPITHLSLYNLTIEPHTVFFKKKETLQLPDSTTSVQMLEHAVEQLQGAGFSRYEISAFARDQKRSCHNIGYWTGRPFLGYGPSACSFWEGARFRNIAHLSRYAAALGTGTDPQDFIEKLDPLMREKEAVAIGLRLLEGLEWQPLSSEMQRILEDLHRKGLVERREGRVQLTERGLLFHDTVAEEIMSG